MPRKLCHRHIVIVHSLDNCINRAIVKVFHVTSSDCVQTICHSVGLLHVWDLIEKKRLKFVNGLLNDIRFTRLFFSSLIVLFTV